MPNIRANFDDASWAYVMKAAPSPDGNIYSYPSPSSIYLANGWGYRDQVFDALGISFPSNTDELYEAAKRIKAEYPDSWPIQGWAKTRGYRSLTGGYLLAWRTWDDWYIDPDTNAVTYGPQTDKYREVMKFINKLYAEDLVFPEVDQKDFTKWSELLAESRHHIMFFNVGRIGHVNSVVDQDDPTAQFKIVHDGVVTAPGLEPIVARGRPFGEGGSIATSATDEQVERWLEYTNFLASPDGGIFMYYGVEGVTFNWGTDESGERIPILMDHMATTANPQGQSMYEQGFVKGMYYPAEYALAATGQGDTMPTQNALSVHPFLRNSNHIIWNLSSDDSDMLADLEVVVTDVRDEYGSKFLFGTLDPNDDGDWNDYLAALERAGLEQVRALRDISKADFVPY